MGYRYRRTITFDHTKVPNSDLTQFVALILGTYSYLATEANGGKVKNANGYDIAFFSDAGRTSKLYWELESYDAATGAVQIWVEVPTLSHETDTTIYMFYGNADISTFQGDDLYIGGDYEGGSAWRNAGGHALHMEDNAANTTVTGAWQRPDPDGNWTAQANTSDKTTTGKIGKALTFNGSSDYAVCNAVDNIRDIWTNMTLCAWVKAPSATGGKTILRMATSGIDIYFGITAHKIELAMYSGSTWTGQVNDGTSNVDDDAWHMVQATWHRSDNITKVYVDGELENTVALANNPALSPSLHWWIGRYPVSSGDWFTGLLDEIRLWTTDHSADWIKAEFNNQNSPGTFYGVGGEVVVGADLWPFFLRYLSERNIGN